MRVRSARRHERQIDAIELPPAAEDVLRRVDIHHREIAAERLAHAARAQDAADDEVFRAVDGVERHAAAEAQRVALGERRADHDRIRLRQEHQRIVEHRLVAGREVCLAQAAIARHVDAEDQEIALPRQPRAHDRFDHRRGHAHLGERLHALQHFFVEARFAGRDLQFRRAGDAIERVLEHRQHRTVRRVHGHEHRHPDDDPHRRQNRAGGVLTHVRPAQKTQQSHDRRSSAMRPSTMRTTRGQLAATCMSCVTMTTVAPSRACRS